MENGIRLNGRALSTCAFRDVVQEPAKAVSLHNSTQEKPMSIAAPVVVLILMLMHATAPWLVVFYT